MVEALEQRLTCSGTVPSDSRLVWLNEPANFVAGHRVPAIRVAVEDSRGDVLRNVKGKVQFDLLGTTGAVNDIREAHVAGGVARLPSLRITKADSYQLEASVEGLPSIVSNSFTVRAGPAFSMKIVSFSVSTQIMWQNDVVVHMLDRFGNLATTDHSLIKYGGSQGGYLAGITGLDNPNAVWNGRGGIFGIRVVEGVGEFGVTGQKPVQVRLKDNNPTIRPIWTPPMLTWVP